MSRHEFAELQEAYRLLCGQSEMSHAAGRRKLWECLNAAEALHAAEDRHNDWLELAEQPEQQVAA